MSRKAWRRGEGFRLARSVRGARSGVSCAAITLSGNRSAFRLPPPTDIPLLKEAWGLPRASLLSALPPLPVGLSTTSSSRPARRPELPTCVSVSPHLWGHAGPLRWKLQEESRHLPAGRLEELAPCAPQLFHLCRGRYLNVLGWPLPSPEPSGPLQPALGWQPPGSRGPSTPCLLVPSSHPVRFPCHAGWLLSYEPSWLRCCPPGGPGLGLAHLLWRLAPLPLAGADPKVASGGARVWGPGPAIGWQWRRAASTEDGGCEKSPRSHPHSQLSSSEVAAPGPGEFLRSVQKIPREGRKVAVNDLSS